jgi:DNA-binding CsgD family transcriptional regulator
MTLTPERSLDSLALTPLQQDIAILVMNGLTNREIADRLGLTPGLVGVQIGRILQRLGLTSRAELAAMRLDQFARAAPPQPVEAPTAPEPVEPTRSR